MTLTHYVSSPETSLHNKLSFPAGMITLGSTWVACYG